MNEVRWQEPGMEADDLEARKTKPTVVCGRLNMTFSQQLWRPRAVRFGFLIIGPKVHDVISGCIFLALILYYLTARVWSPYSPPPGQTSALPQFMWILSWSIVEPGKLSAVICPLTSCTYPGFVGWVHSIAGPDCYLSPASWLQYQSSEAWWSKCRRTLIAGIQTVCYHYSWPRERSLWHNLV